MLKPALLFFAGLLYASPVAASEVTDALASGLRAEANHDGEALLQAAIDLERLGAHPALGTENLSDRWRQEAYAYGTRRPADVPYRGRTLGPAYKRGRVPSQSKFTTRQVFNAGQKAEVSVVVTEPGQLNLIVDDDDNRSPCQITISGSDGACSWVPAWTERYNIEIENLSTSDVGFYLVTN